VQPTREPVVAAYGLGSVCQDQKRCLKSVLGIVAIAEHRPANAKHHRPMPLHKRLECRFVASIKVALDQLAIRSQGFPASG
jgi:hypothetical protein